jgi:aminobenzoyl-glutamate transport protein
MSSPAIPASHSGSLMQRFLNAVERVGNRLPDPAVLFVLLLLVVVALSFLLSGQDFGLIDPRDGKPLVVKNLAAPEHFTAFVSGLVGNFTSFPPLGVVLVSLLGIGVAEHAGFINAGLRALLSVTVNC